MDDLTEPLRETELTVGELLILAAGCPHFLPGEPFTLEEMAKKAGNLARRPAQMMRPERLAGSVASLIAKGLLTSDVGAVSFTEFGEACWKASIPNGWLNARKRARGGKDGKR